MTEQDSWADMRSRQWDADTARLPVLIALLGVGSQPLAVQQQELRNWLEGPAAVPAPEHLKFQVREFLARQPSPGPQPATIPQQQVRWQKKLDEMFPGGAICTWDGDSTVPVAWIRVGSMSGLDPELWFYHPFGWTKNGKVLASLETVQTPPHLIALAKFTDGSTCQLTAAIPDGLAESLAKARADAIAGNVTPA